MPGFVHFRIVWALGLVSVASAGSPLGSQARPSAGRGAPSLSRLVRVYPPLGRLSAHLANRQMMESVASIAAALPAADPMSRDIARLAPKHEGLVERPIRAELQALYMKRAKGLVLPRQSSRVWASHLTTTMSSTVDLRHEMENLLLRLVDLKKLAPADRRILVGDFEYRVKALSAIVDATGAVFHGLEVYVEEAAAAYDDQEGSSAQLSKTERTYKAARALAFGILSRVRTTLQGAVRVPSGLYDVTAARLVDVITDPAVFAQVVASAQGH